MTDTTISGVSTTAHTLLGTDRLFVTGTGQLKPVGTAVTWNFASPSMTGILVDNSGVIASTGGRVFDTSATAATSATSFTLINHEGASITSATDVMRVQKSIAGGSISIDNGGSIVANAGRAFNVQDYVGLAQFNLINRTGALIQSTDDGVRLANSVAAAYAGTISIDNSGTIKTVGAASGQAIDLNDVKATAAAHVTVTNRAGGVIEAADADAIRGSTFTTIENYGRIEGKAMPGSTGNDAIDFQTNGNGAVNNHEGGEIVGARHGIAGTKSVAIDNNGAITGLLGSGINLDTTTGATTIVNREHGVITGNAAGDTDGDAIDVDRSTNITNAGRIEALGISSGGLSEAITIGGGTITNEASGVIQSVQRAITVDDGSGSSAFAATTITNHGTITGANSQAIALVGTFADTVTNDGVVNGDIAAGGGSDTIVNRGTVNGTIFGEAGQDDIRSYGSDSIDAGADDDFVAIYGALSGSRAIAGGTGNDVLNLDASVDNSFDFANLTGFESVIGSLQATDGNDRLDLSSFTASGMLIVSGGEGDDYMIGRSAATILNGDEGGDVLVAADTGNQLFGGAGDDTLHGGAGADILSGGDGDDILSGAAGNDQLSGGAGINSIAAGDGDDEIRSTGVHDAIDAGAGNDTIYFSGLVGGAVDGGEGQDQLNFSRTGMPAASFDGSSGTASFAHIETVSGDLYGSSGNDELYLSTLTASGSLQIFAFDGDDRITGGSEADQIYGGAGDDVLMGGAGDDYLEGGAGDNVLDGGEGNDRLLGNAGNDVLTGGGGDDSLSDFYAGTDSLSGGEGNDWLYSGGGYSSLDGGTGNDTISVGETFAGTIDGGTGDDTIIVDRIGGTIDGGDGNDTLQAAQAGTFQFDASSGTATFANIEQVVGSFVGTAGNDALDLSTLTAKGSTSITGGQGDDVIVGRSEADSIYGGQGNDILSGGGGDDYIEGNTGTNILTGGDGNDVIKSTGFHDDIDGGAGDDTIQLNGLIGGAVSGGSGNDSIVFASLSADFDGTSGSATFADVEQVSGSLSGTSGNDVLDLSTLTANGSLSIWADNGDDRVSGGGEADHIMGGSGNDTLSGGGGDDHLEGGTGTNALSGGEGDDIIESTGTRDDIDAGVGDDAIYFNGLLGGRIDGGSGNDALIFGYSTGQAVFDWTSASAAFAGIETVSGNLSGTANNDFLNLSTLTASGSLYIFAGAGDDRVVGGREADTIDGSWGEDTVVYAGNFADYVVTTVEVRPGVQHQIVHRIDGSEADDELIDVEFVQFADRFIGATVGVGGTYTGTAAANVFTASDNGVWTISGLAGNDTLTGNDNADTVTGGKGNDVLAGAGGNDLFLVGLGDGSDRFDGGSGSDTIRATAANVVIGLTSISGVETISAGGFANVKIAGTAQADGLDFNAATLVGISAIDGGGGNDTIIGSGGDDLIIGGAGNDNLSGGAGNDRFLLAAGAGTDTIDGGDGIDTVQAGVANLKISLTPLTSIEVIDGNGFAGVQIVGSAAGDTIDLSQLGLKDIALIEGGAGNDTIVGSTGADRLSGGTGMDTLSGGAGADMFVYTMVGQSGVGAKADHILDFISGEDLIDLSVIDADISLAGNQTFAFIGADAFTDVGQLRVVQEGDHLAIYGNVNGSLAPDFEIVLQGSASIAASDFLL